MQYLLTYLHFRFGSEGLRDAWNKRTAGTKRRLYREKKEEGEETEAADGKVTDPEAMEMMAEIDTIYRRVTGKTK